MAVAEFRLFLDNQPADDERLDSFSEVRVDQAIGMAAEAELHMDIGLDANGVWSGIDETFAQPLARVRVEVKIRDGDFVALIDGPIVAQRFELSAEPDQSKLVLVVHDDSVLLNRDEAVEVFEDKTVDEIVEQLFKDKDLDAEVTPVTASGGSLGRAEVQRGSAMQMLRELARRHGRWVYVKPGPDPGSSVGVFALPEPIDNDLPELLIMGADRNVNHFSVQLDALRPARARADSVSITDVAAITSEAEAASLKALGDKPAHALTEPGMVLLSRTREDPGDLADATAAAVDASSWAYTARAEVQADMYAGVLSPYQLVAVAGAGGYLGGEYLVSQVTHVLNDSSYKQQFVLRRNARSDVSAGGGGLPGGLL